MQSAALDVDDILMEARQAYKESNREAQDLDVQATNLEAQAEATLERQVHGGPVTSMTAFRAWAGMIMIVASATLGFAMFMSMQIGWPLSLLLASVEAAAFAGVGSLAILYLTREHASGTEVTDAGQAGNEQRLLGAALLIVLFVVAVILIPLLAQARADEMFADRISKAESTVANLTLSTGEDVSYVERSELAAAKHDLEVLPAQRDLAQNIFMVLLAITIGGEILLTSYTADMLVRWRAGALNRRAGARRREAQECEEDARAKDVEVREELTKTGRDYAISMDTIDQLAMTRLAAQESGLASLVSEPLLPGASPQAPPTVPPHNQPFPPAASQPNNAWPPDGDLPPPPDAEPPAPTIPPNHSTQSWDGVWA
jgi:hypothetical protein